MHEYVAFPSQLRHMGINVSQITGISLFVERLAQACRTENTKLHMTGFF